MPSGIIPLEWLSWHRNEVWLLMKADICSFEEQIWLSSSLSSSLHLLHHTNEIWHLRKDISQMSVWHQQNQFVNVNMERRQSDQFWCVDLDIIHLELELTFTKGQNHFWQAIINRGEIFFVAPFFGPRKNKTIICFFHHQYCWRPCPAACYPDEIWHL